MLTPRQIFRRLRDLLRGTRLASDVDDELRFHIEMQTAELVRRGMSPGRARAKAESDFGTVVRVTDGVHSARGVSVGLLMDDLWRDTRFATRSLLRAPAYTVVAIATLALGIGATTAMFGVVNGVLLADLPYPNANRLVLLQERAVSDGRPYTSSVSAPNFRDWKEQARSVDIVAAYRGGPTTVLGLSEPTRATLYAVSHDYFTLFGGVPLRGRTFAATESVPGGDPVAVVSERFWREQLGARADVSDVRLQTWGGSYRIVGVMPAGFGFPDDGEIWVPLEPQNVGMGRSSHNDETIARLAPGATPATAERELQGIAERLKEVYPTDNNAIGAKVTPLRDAIVGSARPYLRLLLLAVAAVLLVACVNLTSANLARGAGRARELSIRTVLGAGRARLARQLLTENLLVAVVGGTMGVALAVWLVRIILALNPTSLPRANAIRIDGSVLLFALFVTVATGLLIGLLPAIQVGRADLRGGMAAGGRGTVVGRSGVRRALVGAEVACAVMLLVAAGLVVRSFRTLLNARAGFEPAGVLAVTVTLPDSRYATGNSRSAYFTQAVDAVRSIPGVQQAAMINIAPLSRAGFGGGMNVEGRPTSDIIYADYRIISPEYFETMHISLIAGRSITAVDDSTSPHVTVINQAMAKRFFPGENPLGKRLRELGMDRHRDVWMTVVGVVGDVRSADLAKAAIPQHFVPVRQRPERANFGVLVLRTGVDPASIGPAVRSRLRLIDANVLMTLETMDEIRSHSVGDRRFTTVLLGGFAVLGLVLAAIGIYGVLAYSVARRTREIGVRMALGAARGRVVRMVLNDSLTPVAFGAAVGVAGALAATRLMRAMLYEVSASDPLTFVLVVAVLFAVAVLASVVPAMRAARVDPIVALREE